MVKKCFSTNNKVIWTVKTFFSFKYEYWMQAFIYFAATEDHQEIGADQGTIKQKRGDLIQSSKWNRATENDED